MIGIGIPARIPRLRLDCPGIMDRLRAAVCTGRGCGWMGHSLTLSLTHSFDCWGVLGWFVSQCVWGWIDELRLYVGVQKGGRAVWVSSRPLGWFVSV